MEVKQCQWQASSYVWLAVGIVLFTREGSVKKMHARSMSISFVVRRTLDPKNSGLGNVTCVLP